MTTVKSTRVISNMYRPDAELNKCHEKNLAGDDTHTENRRAEKKKINWLETKETKNVPSL